MKMLRERALSILLISVLFITMFAGCGKSRKKSDNSAEVSIHTEGYPIVDKKITFRMMGAKHPIHGEWKKLVFFQEMEKKTNIAFKFDTPTLEAFEEKKNLALNGDNYADVLFGALLSKIQQVKYGTQGILIPLEDYVDKYCPNLTKMFNKYPQIKQSVTAPDGHIYALPQYTVAPIAMMPTLWVNTKWLKAMNKTDADLPKTTDELYSLLAEMKTSDPNGNNKKDEIPLSFGDNQSKGDSIYANFMPAFGIPGRDFYVDDNGKIQYGLMHDNAVKFFEYINKLWKEKLIDNDVFSQGQTDMAAKGANNLIGIASQALPGNIWGAMSNEEAAEYLILPALSSSVSSEAMVQQSNSGIIDGTFAVTDKCKNVPAIMRWVDYLYSEEGSLLIHYGPEGLAYKANDDGVYEQILPTDGRSYEERRGGDITPDCGISCPKFVRASTEGNWGDPLQQTRVKQVDEKLWPYRRLPLPDLFFTVKEQEKIDIQTTDLKKYASEVGAKLITGEMSLDDYNKVLDRLEQMKIVDAIKTYQTVYDRWVKSGK
jgi:putative aldouronate transport system substrate-binding protein